VNDLSELPQGPEGIRLVYRDGSGEVVPRRVVYAGLDLEHDCHDFEAWFSLSEIDQTREITGSIAALPGKTAVVFRFEP
jgi:hypothetical protein